MKSLGLDSLMSEKLENPEYKKMFEGGIRIKNASAQVSLKSAADLLLKVSERLDNLGLSRTAAETLLLADDLLETVEKSAQEQVEAEAVEKKAAQDFVEGQLS